MDTNQKEMILNRLKECPGDIGFYYKSLVTGDVVTYNEQHAFLAASEIKLPIFVDIMTKAAKGLVDMNRKIQIMEEDLLPSCGAINLFSKCPSLDLRTICNFMIALSDNTATNILIREMGFKTLNTGFREMGLENTKLERMLFDAEGAKKGLQNRFVPQEYGILLEKLHLGQIVDKTTSDDILKTLKMQNINHKIPALMEERYEVAHKTGEDDNITHDAGIVYCENPFIVVFASNNTDVGIFEDAIRHISLELTKQ